MRTFFNVLSLFLMVGIISCTSNKVPYPVKVGGKWGYISSDGKYVVNLLYDKADCFSDGLARVNLDGKVGYINSKGKNIIPIDYLGGTSFVDGKAFVTRSECYPICINKKGKELFQVDSVEYVYALSDNMAKIVTSNGLYGFINGKGEKVVIPQYDDAHNFSEGLAAVKKGDLWGYVDKKGKIVIEPKYKSVGSFSGGLSPVKEDDLYGYIDQSGIIKINEQFSTAGDFNDGIAVVKIDDEYGYINKTGQFIINPQFSKAEPFSDGVAMVKRGSYGFIDKNGSYVINPQYESATSFQAGYAFYINVEDSFKYGLIDKNGESVISPQFYDISSPEQNIVMTRSNCFDGQSFIDNQFSTWESNSFYGYDSNTTLGEIQKSFSIRKGPNDSTVAFVQKKVDKVDGVGLTSGVFGFDKKTYKLVDNYRTSWFWGTFKDGKKREYIKSCALRTAEYRFELDGVASEKGLSLTRRFADEISSRLAVEYQVRDNVFYIPFSSEHPGYMISGTSDYSNIKVIYSEQ